MRRFSFALLLAALVLGLALPATTAAASPYTYTKVVNVCRTPYPAYSVPYIKVKMTKPAGWLSGDRFTIDSQLQHKDYYSGGWVNEGSVAVFARPVPNQYSKFSWSKAFYYEPDDYDWHRIVLTLKVWDGMNVIATSTVRSVKCLIQ